MGGLASCVAFCARRYRARHDLPTAGLAVTATFVMAEGPARVGEVQVDVTVPERVPDERRAGLLAVARHCSVHNSLAQPPQVTIELAA